jgi:ADP-ribosylglycohydrolase
MIKITAKQVESVLLGVAVGDALGVPWEFQPRGSFHCERMSGYGTHNQPPGTWSDDTSLTLCLADAMAGGFTGYSLLEKTGDNFVRWFEKDDFTAHGKVFDIGISTTRAILKLKRGVPPAKSGCADVSENGNGSLMRIAPLVFHIADKPHEERYGITSSISSITHAHEWSVAACFIYLEYLRELSTGMGIHLGKVCAYDNLKRDFQNDSPYIARDTLDKFSRILRQDIRALPEAAIKSGGFVVDTLEAAFWCFLTTDNYRDAVLKAVNLGDDTDTTAAVTGGLAGLYYGFGESGVPRDWAGKLARVQGILSIADRIAKRCNN